MKQNSGLHLAMLFEKKGLPSGFIKEPDFRIEIKTNDFTPNRNTVHDGQSQPLQ